MKILMISSIPEKLDNITGGVESVTVNLLYGFAGLDVEMNVISFRQEIKKHYIFEFTPNIKIYYYPFRFIKSTKIFFILSGAGTVYKHVKLFKPDIIHLEGNGSIYLLLNRLNNPNIIITPHANLKKEYLDQITLRKKINYRIIILIEYFVMKRLHNYIFISEYLRKSLQENKSFRQVNHHSIIFNPVNPIFFNVKDNELRNRFNILYIGQISKRKGLIDLIKSLSKLKGKGIIYHLNVVGDFSDKVYKELIFSEVKENNLDSQVLFSGWLSQKSIAKLMEDNGIFILPSNQESLPMSIIESMSSGRLVIATDVGGIPEIIKNEETGYLYKKNNQTQLSSILETLFYNPSEFIRISNNARLYSKNNFLPLAIAQKTKEFYSSVIAQ